MLLTAESGLVLHWGKRHRDAAKGPCSRIAMNCDYYDLGKIRVRLVCGKAAGFPKENSIKMVLISGETCGNRWKGGGVSFVAWMRRAQGSALF